MGCCVLLFENTLLLYICNIYNILHYIYKEIMPCDTQIHGAPDHVKIKRIVKEYTMSFKRPYIVTYFWNHTHCYCWVSCKTQSLLHKSLALLQFTTLLML